MSQDDEHTADGADTTDPDTSPRPSQIVSDPADQTTTDTASKPESGTGGVRLTREEHDALLARMGIDPDERRRARVTRPRRPGDPMWW